MQLLPTTAERFGVMPEQLTNPDMNIMAGSRYIQYLDNFWYKRVADTSQIKFFVLASYNSGPGHVLDAMRLAEKHGLNPNLWFDNVELMMLKKSEPKYYRDPVVKSGYCNGIQVVVYVNKVLDYYQKYQEFVLGASVSEANLALAMSGL
jgi:membrane-bound lytic murein transglycosylase F